MSYRDTANRRRWSLSQRESATEAFARDLPNADQARSERLAALRQMDALMARLPQMAPTRANVLAEIARLEYAHIT